MKLTSTISGAVISAFLTLGVISGIYWEILSSPSQYLFSARGDGIKNYYTFAFHVKNDSSGWESRSMNYPNTENLFFLDSNPLLAKIARIFVSPESDHNQLIGWYNLLMLLSIPLSAIFIFLMGRSLKLSFWSSFLGAIGLALLNPAIMRMTGHFSLSFSFFVPLSLWLMLEWRASGKPFWLLVFVLSALPAYFVHPYLGMIMSLGMLAFSIADLILTLDFSRRQSLRTAYSILAGLVPLLFFYISVSTLDQHVGRTSNPYGFLVYVAHPADLIVPVIGPIRELAAVFFELPQPHWEGIAYLGFGVMVTYTISLLILRQKIFNGTLKPLHVLIVSAILLYAFACGFPFNFGLGFLADSFPIIKSFRSTGRFAWPLFFAAGIGAFYLLEKLTSKKKTLGTTLALLLCLSLIWESLAFHNMLVYSFDTQNPFHSELLEPELKAIVEKSKNQEVDALIPIPFYSHGSDNFVIEDHKAAKHSSMSVAYHLNTPIMAMAGARTSIPEARQNASTLFRIFSSESPLEEKYLIVLDSDQNLDFPETEYLSFFKWDSNSRYQSAIVSDSDLKAAYFNAIEGIDSLIPPLVYDSYDEGNTSYGYHQQGTHEIPANRTDTLYAVENNTDSVFALDFSFWILNNNDINYGQDYLIGNIAQVLDEQGVRKSMRMMASKVVDGDWSQINFKNESLGPGEKIYLVVKSKWDLKGKLYVDDLWVNSANSHSMVNHQQKRIVDNFQLPN